MSLRLLIDECILDKRLVSQLREAGHDVVTATEAGLTRKPDHAVFEAAISDNRLVLTINHLDFADLSRRRVDKGGTHPGILLIHRYNVPSKEMKNNEIVRAIANLEATNVPLANQCHSLNRYNY